VSRVGDRSQPRSIPVDLHSSQLGVRELELPPLERDASLSSVPEREDGSLRRFGTVGGEDLGLEGGEGSSVGLFGGDVSVDGDGDDGT